MTTEDDILKLKERFYGSLYADIWAVVDELQGNVKTLDRIIKGHVSETLKIHELQATIEEQKKEIKLLRTTLEAGWSELNEAATLAKIEEARKEIDTYKTQSQFQLEELKSSLSKAREAAEYLYDFISNECHGDIWEKSGAKKCEEVLSEINQVLEEKNG